MVDGTAAKPEPYELQTVYSNKPATATRLIDQPVIPGKSRKDRLFLVKAGDQAEFPISP